MNPRLLLLCLLAVTHATATVALPEGLRFEAGDERGAKWTQSTQWTQWGSGEMTWFGLALYRATLWVASPRGREDGREMDAVQGGEKRNDKRDDGGQGLLHDDTPFALTLEYRRDIPAGRIVQASVDEMRKLGASEEQLQRWEREMRRVFPDVRKGDLLTGLYLPGRGARFFYQARDIGEVRDAEFARRFFAIWLDPRTSAPEVRAALLRQRAG